MTEADLAALCEAIIADVIVRAGREPVMRELVQKSAKMALRRTLTPRELAMLVNVDFEADDD